MKHWLFLAIAILAEVVVTVSLKANAPLTLGEAHRR